MDLSGANNRPSVSGAHHKIASKAYADVTQSKETVGFGAKIMRAICNFLGVSSIEDPRLEAEFSQVAAEVESLFTRIDQKNSDAFNEEALALREHLAKIGMEYAELLPDDFDANAFIEHVFQSCAKELPAESIITLYESSNEDWGAYDNILMASILDGTRVAMLENKRMTLGEQAVISFNTRIECFGSHFQSTNVGAGDQDSVGSGVSHSVVSVPYDVSQFKDENGVQRTKAFKPIDEREAFSDDMEHFPDMLGLELVHDKPVRTRFLERNVVVSNLDEWVNFGVIARTEPASHQGKRGIVMELYASKPGAATDIHALDRAKPMNELSKEELEAVHSSPEYRRDSVKLQLIDVITGQIDRHEENYLLLFNQSGEYLGLRGIDSDGCLGSKEVPQCEDGYYHNQVGLPQVIDTEMYESVMALTSEDIEALGAGKLTEAEISATKKRLASVQAHVQNLKAEGRVIEPDAWGEDGVQTWLKELDFEFPHSSYYKREYQYLEIARNRLES